MNEELQPARVLHDRFVLQRRLHATASSQLWTAHDRQLDAPVVLRVYVATALAGDGVVQTIKRDARHYRRMRHPDVAHVHDLHEAGDLLVLSIEPREGELLSTVLDRGEPMPYRVVVERIRPLVEALLHLHGSGGEHGRLDPDHLIVDGESAWTLLPGDGTVPARDDMRQLGRLMAELLTGGRAPGEDRSLNDLAERLHEGRTVPALLNQLVSDLREKEATLRPSSMRDVLHRLDQLEDYVEVPETARRPEAAPSAVLEPRIATPTLPHASSKGRLGWVLVPVVLVVGAILLLAIGSWTRSGATPVEDRPPPITDAVPDEPAPPVDAGRIEAERTAAEQALDRYLVRRQAADSIGAATWGGEPYETAAAVAVTADQSFLDQRFADAARQYDEAARSFQGVIDGKDQALRLLMLDGADALKAPDAARATAAFQSALMIAPDHDDAELGLQRAVTLDELHRLLASGAVHEAEGRSSLAHADYMAAAQLDPHSPEAAAAYTRIKERLADDEFQAMMSAGLEAFHRGDFDEARTRLEEAQRFRPGAEVEQALAMVQEARLRAEVERLETLARAHEASEQWQAAWTAYRRVLAIDATIAFAQEGKVRSESMIELDERMRRYLDEPALLTKRGTRDDARQLVEELGRRSDMGPRMRAAYAELAELVRLANTPVRVVLRSDERTSVDVYRVGRYDAFAARELELLPGVYTVVGHRRGFKDVRHTLVVKAGENATLEVVCTEPVG